ncbi:MAG: hypothetical protein Q9191_005091 [Dirinaria sp. TL-2023a]
MGGGSDTEQQHLLIALPFEEPTKSLERLKKNFPRIKVSYVNLNNLPSLWEDVARHVPKDIRNQLSTIQVEPTPKISFLEQDFRTFNELFRVIMTTLVQSHSYNLLHRWQKEHQWRRDYAEAYVDLRQLHDLVGQRLGVLGYGSIGRQVARVASAMGMSVLAYTASPRATRDSKKDKGFIVPRTGDPDGTIPEAWYSGLDKEDLHHFLAQDLDYLLVCVPLTEQTRHFLAAPEFEILSKRNTFVSNIARGQIINQDDLISALRQYDTDRKAGKTGDALRGLRGAALDVTDPEPLPEDHPLWDAPNTIVTPHISGLSSEYMDRALQVLEVNLERRENGEKLVNEVDRKRGY